MNVFDQLNGYDESDELNGLFSKLEKKIKKGFRSVNKIRSKVASKILPSKVREIGRKIDKAGVNKLAAGIALTMIGIPALGAIGGQVGAVAAKGFGLAKGAIGGIKVGGLVKTATTVYSTTNKLKLDKAKQNIIIAQTKANANKSLELSRAIGDSPQFAQAVQSLRAQGYDDEAILNHWRESKSYYAAAVPEVARTVYPQIYGAAVESGLPENLARDYAKVESLDVAKKEVKKAQGGGGIIIAAVGIALLMLNK